MMETLIRGLRYAKNLVHLDDIIFYAQDLEDHKRKLEIHFERLIRANLNLQPDKMQYLKEEVVFSAMESVEQSSLILRK